MDWLDLLAVQGTLRSLLQHHSSKASILQHSTFFMVQLSHPYMTTGKTITLTRWTFVGQVMSLLYNMLSRLVTTSLSLFFFFSVTAPFYLEDIRRIQDSKRREWRSAWGGGGCGREREKEGASMRVRTREIESERKHFGPSFYMFFPPPGPTICKLGLARSAVYSVCSA